MKWSRRIWRRIFSFFDLLTWSNPLPNEHEESTGSCWYFQTKCNTKEAVVACAQMTRIKLDLDCAKSLYNWTCIIWVGVANKTYKLVYLPKLNTATNSSKSITSLLQPVHISLIVVYDTNFDYLAIPALWFSPTLPHRNINLFNTTWLSLFAPVASFAHPHCFRLRRVCLVAFVLNRSFRPVWFFCLPLATWLIQ